MCRFILALSLALIGCTPLPESARTPEIPVSIYVNSWDAARVRLFCDGESIARKVIPITPFKQIESKLRLRTCNSWRIVVQDIGGKSFSTEPFPLTRYDELTIEVGIHSSQIFYRMMR